MRNAELGPFGPTKLLISPNSVGHRLSPNLRWKKSNHNSRIGIELHQDATPSSYSAEFPLILSVAAKSSVAITPFPRDAYWTCFFRFVVTANRIGNRVFQRDSRSGRGANRATYRTSLTLCSSMNSIPRERVPRLTYVQDVYRDDPRGTAVIYSWSSVRATTNDMFEPCSASYV